MSKYYFLPIFLLLAHASASAAKECSADIDCPHILTCLSGTCHEENDPEECGQRSDCLRSKYGYECVQGRCGCTSTNHDCPAGNFCTKKRCLLTGKFCNTNKECSGSNKGHICEDGQCVCYANTHCNTDHECVEKECVMKKTEHNIRRRRRQIFEGTMREQMNMEMIGHPAHQDFEDISSMGHGSMPGIPGDMDSMNTPCVSTMDCQEAAGGVCVEGLCGCSNQEDCRDGTMCTDGQCG